MERLDGQTELLQEQRGHHCCGSEGRLDEEVELLREWRRYHCCGSEGNVRRINRTELLWQWKGHHCCGSERMKVREWAPAGAGGKTLLRQ